ncbi:MAG: hypothetical protein WBC93_21875 [Sulfitobacter sp.]
MKISGRTLRQKLEKVFASKSYQRAPDGFIGANGPTKVKIIRTIISAYRKKAQSELPEILGLIHSERRGVSEVLKKQYRANRDRMLESVGDKSIERVFAPRRSRVKLFENASPEKGNPQRKSFSSMLEGN